MDPSILGKEVKLNVGDVLLQRLHDKIIETPKDGTFKPHTYDLFMRSWVMNPRRYCPSPMKNTEFVFDLAAGDFVD